MNRLALAQRWVGWLLLGVFWLLLVDSAFLLLSPAPDGWVPLAIRAHEVLGYAFLALLGPFALLHVWHKQYHRTLRVKQLGWGLLGVVIIATGLGGTLVWFGKSRGVSWLVWSHAVGFALAILGYGAHRFSARTGFRARREGILVALSVVFAGVLWGIQAAPPLESPIQNAARAELQAGATRADSIDGHLLDATLLDDPDYCAGCHADVAKQWRGSVHRHSSFTDPFYAKTFARLQEHRSAEATRFCGGCHDPLVLFSGNMNGNVSRASPYAESGITCLVCHGITEVRDRVGVGGYVLSGPQHYPFYDASDSAAQDRHARLIRSRPEQHKQSLLKPELHREASFCLPCHKAHVPASVNGERWRPGQNDWDPWFDSSASRKSARTFFHTDQVKRCQDCHMPLVESNDPAAKDGKIRSHRFVGANSALALVHDDSAWQREIDTLLQGCASIDVFAAQPHEGPRLFPLEDAEVRWPAGANGVIEVVVTNRRVGHLFPGGTSDLAEVWVELVVAAGDTKLVSGYLDRRGHLDPDAHRLHSVLLKANGERLLVHEVEELRAVLYNRSIPLGASDVVRFALPQLDVPAGGTLQITARLLHRKFPRDYVEFALGPDSPELPIVAIDESRVTLRVGEEARTGTATSPLVPRLLNHGIGSLRTGDTRAARTMFRLAADLAPSDPDPHVFLARAARSDGALDDAEQALSIAERLRPGYWKSDWQLGQLRAAQGKYEQAIAMYQEVLEQFPEDRVVWKELGSSLLRTADVARARAVFERVLAVDPEDSEAHTGLARALSRLGEQEAAEHHIALSERFRPPRSELSVQGVHRLRHPPADREASDPHVHPLRDVRGEPVSLAQVR